MFHRHRNPKHPPFSLTKTNRDYFPRDVIRPLTSDPDCRPRPRHLHEALPRASSIWLYGHPGHCTVYPIPDFTHASKEESNMVSLETLSVTHSNDDFRSVITYSNFGTLGRGQYTWAAFPNLSEVYFRSTSRWKIMKKLIYQWKTAILLQNTLKLAPRLSYFSINTCAQVWRH